MRSGGAVEWIGAADADLKLAPRDPAEKISSSAQQLITAGDVVDKRRAGDEQRPAAGEALQLERRNRPTGRAVEDHVAAWTKGGQALVEGRPADAVVHDSRADAVGDLSYHGGEVLVVGDVVRSGVAGELGLVSR